MKYSIAELRALYATTTSEDPTKDHYDLQAYQHWTNDVFVSHGDLQDALPDLLDLLEEAETLATMVRLDYPSLPISLHSAATAFLDKLKKEAPRGQESSNG